MSLEVSVDKDVNDKDMETMKVVLNGCFYLFQKGKKLFCVTKLFGPCVYSLG